MKAENQKHAILFFPQNIGTYNKIFELLTIAKNGNQLSYSTNPIEKQSLKTNFKSLVPENQEAILEFSATGQKNASINYKNIVAKAHSFQQAETLLQKTYLRNCYNKISKLIKSQSDFKWYQRINQTAKLSKTEPIQFNDVKPELQLSIQLINNQYQIGIQLKIADTIDDLMNFSRYHFLVEKNRIHYLLLYTDYETITWLQTQEVIEAGYDADIFKQKVIATLEKNYTLNRNGFFPATIINETPSARVLLSELNNAFLMLTPQWLYDGYVVDGKWEPIKHIRNNGELICIHRNQAVELALVNDLRNLHVDFGQQHNGYFYLSFEKAEKKHWFLKTYQYLLEQNIEVVGIDLLQHFRYSPHQVETIFNIIEEENQLLQCTLEVNFGKENISLVSLQKALWSGQKAIVLKDGSLGILTDEWLRTYAIIIKHGTIQNKFLWVAKWLVCSDQHIATHLNIAYNYQLSEEWWNNWKKWQNDCYNLAFPPSINASLRTYQQKGFEWMVLLSQICAGGCLADDMGLGKTLQSICFLAHLHSLNPHDKFLIICPASLVYNWQSEFEKFAPSLKTGIYYGASRNVLFSEKNAPNMIITTYGTLRSDVETLKNFVYEAVIADESHHFKNPSSLIAKSIGQLVAKTKIALSGTPIMNNTFDLYAQFQFIIPGLLGGKEFFRREYALPIDREKDLDKIQILKKLTAPFILRRTKEQVVTDLPEKQQSIIWCKMPHEQKQIYDSIREQIKSSVFLEIREKGLQKGKLNILNGMLQLRQICNATNLLNKPDITNHYSVKTNVLIEEIKQLLPFHKILVFSQFTSMLNLLEDALQLEKIAFLRLDGSTSISQRQQMVEKFQQENIAEKVFLLSLKAGNAGLNLTQADYVFIFDPWWNTAVQQQAIDRAHRIGQTKKVFAYHLICKNTIEEKIIQLQQRKEQLSTELINEDENFVQSLTEEDIAFLLS